MAEKELEVTLSIDERIAGLKERGIVMKYRNKLVDGLGVNSEEFIDTDPLRF